MKLENPVITSIRLPKSVLDRIKILAEKQHWSTNQWMVITLERESRKRMLNNTGDDVLNG
jgi:hypothetical protein